VPFVLAGQKRMFMSSSGRRRWPGRRRAGRRGAVLGDDRLCSPRGAELPLLSRSGRCVSNCGALVGGLRPEWPWRGFDGWAAGRELGRVALMRETWLRGGRLHAGDAGTDAASWPTGGWRSSRARPGGTVFVVRARKHEGLVVGVGLAIVGRARAGRREVAGLVMARLHVGGPRRRGLLSSENWRGGEDGVALAALVVTSSRRGICHERCRSERLTTLLAIVSRVERRGSATVCR